MTLKEQLLQELDSTPDPILEQVFNFLRIFKNSSVVSEPSSPSQPHQSLSNEERLAKAMFNDIIGLTTGTENRFEYHHSNPDEYDMVLS